MYNVEISNPLSYLEVMQKYNITEQKLRYDNKFYLLNKNNIQKLISQSQFQVVLDKKQVLKIKQDILGQIIKYKTCWVIQRFYQVYEIDFD